MPVSAFGRVPRGYPDQTTSLLIADPSGVPSAPMASCLLRAWYSSQDTLTTTLLSVSSGQTLSPHHGQASSYGPLTLQL